jgi:hypothetical protein
LAVYSQRLFRSRAPDCPVVHRTVSGAPGCLGRRSRSREFADGVRLKFTGLSGVHRTCPVRQICNGRQRSAVPFMERNRAPDSVRCAPDCPVHPTTEGKDGLPDLFSTAPSCLGAIKGTPRRMEEYTKHSYNIPKHQDIDLAHSFHCDSI